LQNKEGKIKKKDTDLFISFSYGHFDPFFFNDSRENNNSKKDFKQLKEEYMIDSILEI
jgi:hypothetical protein